MADIFKEDCEGTGRPSGWTNYGGNANVNWDYTTGPLAGSQSLRMTCPSGWTVDYYAFTEQNTVNFYFMFNVATVGDSGGYQKCDLVHFDNDSFYQVGAISWGPNDKLFVYDTSLGGAETTYSLSTGVTYHVWVERIANSTLKVYINTSATKPGSPEYNATPCYNDGAGLIALICDPGGDQKFDNLYAATTTIGSDPFGGASSTPIYHIMNQ